MASFVDIIHIINRMPLELSNVMRERMAAAPEDVEKDVLAWGKANPEPRYPTWAEWLCEVGVSRISSYEDGKVVYSRTRKYYEEMDADTAKALGISPKPAQKA